MAAAITVRSATNSVVAKVTFAHIEVTGVDDNAADGTEKRYYLMATTSGQDALRSYVFGPSSDGKHTWNDVMFPAAATWTLTLKDVSDDSTVATHSLTVS